jgi:integrase
VKWARETMTREEALAFGKVSERPGRKGVGRIDVRPFGDFLYSDRGDRFRSREDADHTLAAMREEIKKGEPVALVVAWRTPKTAKEHTLRAHLEAYLDYVKAKKRSATTLREYQQLLTPTGYFSDFLDEPASALTYARIEDWQTSLLERGLSEKAVANAAITLRALLRWLKKRDALTEVPEFPEAPSAEEHRPKLVSLEVIESIIAEMREDMRAIYLALRTGIRPGEARALDVEDWDREAGVLIVRHAMQGAATTPGAARGRIGSSVRLS